MALFSTTLLLVQSFWLSLHPFHASVCEIEYNAKTESLEISYRMFLDDLEMALNKKYEAGLDIMKVDQKEKTDKLVEEYLKEQFKFWVDGKKVNISYLGSEIEGYALWCFIEIPKIGKPSTLEVDNNVMLEIFDDQINLVHFNKEDQVRSLKLYKDNTYGSLKLQGLVD